MRFRIQNETHVCPQLARIIPHMQNVRLRMYRICSRIFDWKHYGPSAPRIESIIVNVSLIELNCFFARFSHHCSDAKRPWELYGDMVDAAEELTKQMPTPSSLKVLRILSHKLVTLDIVARDCIAVTKSILDHDVYLRDWNAVGKPDPEDE